MRTILVLGFCVIASACGSDKPASPVDRLMSELTKDGLQPGALAPVEVAQLGDGKCRRTEVSGIEMTVCEYGDASRAKKHEAPGLALVGETTGAALAQDKLLLVVADRKGVDKDGKRIDKITRAFRGR